MKKISLLITFLFCTVIIITSCRKEHEDETKYVTLNITIQAGTAYTLDLSKYGDSDDLSEITTQAADYTTSEISQPATPGIYTFLKNGSPKVGENSKETVVLRVYEPEGRKHDDETIITINFTIQ